jgi:hypothetical protein
LPGYLILLFVGTGDPGLLIGGLGILVPLLVLPPRGCSDDFAVVAWSFRCHRAACTLVGVGPSYTLARRVTADGTLGRVLLPGKDAIFALVRLLLLLLLLLVAAAGRRGVLLLLPLLLLPHS